MQNSTLCECVAQFRKATNRLKHDLTTILLYFSSKGSIEYKRHEYVVNKFNKIDFLVSCSTQQYTYEKITFTRLNFPLLSVSAEYFRN